MMLLLLGLALCAALGMYLFKCIEMKDAQAWYEEQLAENRELSQLNDSQRRAITGLHNDLSDAKRKLRDVRQNYSDVVAALDKTGTEYNWLVKELEGARIRWSRKKSETIESLLARMPDLSGQWAGEVQDVGPFTTWNPEDSSNG